MPNKLNNKKRISPTTTAAIGATLTLIGGFIPSKKASKQDPVIALRTE